MQPEMHTYILTDRQTSDIMTDRQACNQTVITAVRQANKQISAFLHTYLFTDRHTYRHPDKHTYKRTDRRTDKYAYM